MKFKQLDPNPIRLMFFAWAFLLAATPSAVAMDSQKPAIQPRNEEKVGIFVFSAEEFAESKDEFSDAIANNGVDKTAIKSYVESNTFGFQDFSREVIAQSGDLTKVMVIFHFHGANAGGCKGCDASPMCLQGNLCAKHDRYIGAQQIVDDFLVPLAGKELALFFQSCFSGHLAQKVQHIASKKTWEKPTPIALIATDNNTPTSSVYFPYPDFAWTTTKFDHWLKKEHAQRYETMKTFPEFVEFVNMWGKFFTFTFFGVHGGEKIDIVPFGFKNVSLKPYQEMFAVEELYRAIDKKLSTVDVSNLVVVIVERERQYENLKNGDMWIKAFEQHGVARANIHWAKAEKATADEGNPQVHTFADDFDFIKADNNVLFFVRGDEIVDDSPLWRLMHRGDSVVTINDLATTLLPKMTHAQRVLVLLCSTYADQGFKEFVPRITDQRNVGVVAFFTPSRSLHRSTMYGWPMGMLAPFYNSSFLFMCDGDFQNVYPKCPRMREVGLQGLNRFESMVSFEDYLKFLQKFETFPAPENMAVISHNVERDDLARFGFLPNKLPATWYRW